MVWMYHLGPFEPECKPKALHGLCGALPLVLYNRYVCASVHGWLLLSEWSPCLVEWRIVPPGTTQPISSCFRSNGIDVLARLCRLQLLFIIVFTFLRITLSI